MKITEIVKNFVYPRRCVFCSEPLELNSEFLVCDNCANNVDFIKNPCYMCGRPKSLCKCHGKKREYISLVAPFPYSGIYRSAVLHLKRSPIYGDTLARYMKETVDAHYGNVKFDYIAYIPFDEETRKLRAFNQSEVLAHSLSKLMKVPVCDCIVKMYRTKRQHDLNLYERHGNVFGAFDIENPEKIAGKTILLADDVSTSGATLGECALMLNLYGADAVYCVSVAVAGAADNKT